MSTQTLMKDGLGEPAIRRISNGLIAAGADFATGEFYRDAMNGLDSLELKQRVDHLVHVIGKHLPKDFENAARILGKIRDHWDLGDPDDSLRNFAAWPIINYVSNYGINHPDIALPLLRYLTPLFSAEFAIRPFLLIHPEQTYNQMTLWCLDSDEHVRRLASEGIRPRLPWAPQLAQYIDDPRPVLFILDSLVDDPSDYVRRSVANNLNDISKDHPDLVIETCKQWQADQVRERQWIITRGTRTLVKAGHPEVFSLLGYTRKPKLKLGELSITPQAIQLGETLHISIPITSTSDKVQKIVIDYVIHFVKANGKSKPKVFKWRNLQLKPGKTTILEKKHTITEITTRRYYAGIHKLEIQINGKVKASSDFELLENKA